MWYLFLGFVYPSVSSVKSCRVLWSSKGEVSVIEIYSDNSEECGILPEMDKDINRVSQEFWLWPTLSSIGVGNVDGTCVFHHPMSSK